MSKGFRFWKIFFEEIHIAELLKEMKHLGAIENDFKGSKS